MEQPIKLKIGRSNRNESDVAEVEITARKVDEWNQYISEVGRQSQKHVTTNYTIYDVKGSHWIVYIAKTEEGWNNEEGNYNSFEGILTDYDHKYYFIMSKDKDAASAL